MARQEKIKEGLFNYFIKEGEDAVTATANTDDILTLLSKLGVVIKVERELPDTIPILPKFHKQGIITDDDLLEYAKVTEMLNRMEYIKAGYVAVEPLVKGE